MLLSTASKVHVPMTVAMFLCLCFVLCSVCCSQIAWCPNSTPELCFFDVVLAAV